MPTENEAVKSPAATQGTSAGTPGASVGVGAKLSQVVARLNPMQTPPAAAASAGEQSENVDSFGQVISERDRQVSADTRPLPQFVNGVLTAPSLPAPSETPNSGDSVGESARNSGATGEENITSSDGDFVRLGGFGGGSSGFLAVVSA